METTVIGEKKITVEIGGVFASESMFNALSSRLIGDLRKMQEKNLGFGPSGCIISLEFCPNSVSVTVGIPSGTTPIEITEIYAALRQAAFDCRFDIYERQKDCQVELNGTHLHVSQILFVHHKSQMLNIILDGASLRSAHVNKQKQNDVLVIDDPVSGKTKYIGIVSRTDEADRYLFVGEEAVGTEQNA